ncbi:MAG: polyamine aminopropyltransferase [Spirochaetaceae bacterium]|nr:MAG: polyamine aminopropyltransferase [Spirochaetaceae bacterium]
MSQKDKRILQEWLNNSHGFFYTINRTLHKGSTKYQDIELVDTDEMGNVLLLDNITQVGERVDWQYHEPMVHMPMLAHPNPKTVLVIGGGDGGILREVLRYESVKHIDFVELDEEVVSFSRKYLQSVNGGAFENPKVHARFEDGRGFVERTDTVYDVVIMDMTDPFGPSKMLYTREFYTHVRNRLDPNTGIFTMHSESPVTRPVAFQCVRRTLGAVFPVVRTTYTFIQMYATFWSITLASNGPDIQDLDPATVDSRIRARGISDLKIITGDTWQAMQVEYPYIAEITHRDVPIITDAAPDFPDHFSQ